MARYPEVPDWWFLLILVLAIVLSVVFLEIYDLATPVWLTFLVIGINLVFAVPLSFLSATTGTNLGLGSLIQVITGFLLPGNYNAYLYAQTLGSWALAGYSDNYVQVSAMLVYFSSFFSFLFDPYVVFPASQHRPCTSLCPIQRLSMRFAHFIATVSLTRHEILNRTKKWPTTAKSPHAPSSAAKSAP